MNHSTEIRTIMMDKEISTIAVMTSGGDSPGMNAALRAVVRGANRYNLTIWGIYRGYQGLIEDKFVELDSEKVSNIVQRGGTILKSARSKDFRTEGGRAQAALNLKNKGIDAMVVIGGDGTFTGANLLSKEYGIRVIGIPATIDNDIIGTDETIGYDTALNTAI